MKIEFGFNKYERNPSFILPLVKGFEAIAKDNNLQVSINNSVYWGIVTVNNSIRFYISIWDVPAFRNECLDVINKNDFKLIFKFQYCTKFKNSYPVNTVPGGFTMTYHEAFFNDWDYSNLMSRKRPIDICSRMSIYKNKPETDWLLFRRKLINNIVPAFEKLGYPAKTERVVRAQYLNELSNTNIGFDWRGYGIITFRMVEYIKYGVPFITTTEIKDFELPNGINIEHDKHAILLDNPDNYYKAAYDLLKDKSKQVYMRKNLLELWRDKFNEKELAKWYLSKFKEHV